MTRKRIATGRRDFLKQAGIFSLIGLAGCGGGKGSVLSPGGGNGNGGNGNPSERATGAVTGTLARDGSGALLLIRAGEPVPSGATPLDGATLRVTGGGAAVRSDAGGRFVLPGTPAGLQSLTVEAAGLTSTTTVPLTVIGGATIDLGVSPVTRAAALEKAKSALTAAGIADLNGVTILSPQQPLPAGVLVVPRLDAAEITGGVPGAKTMARPSWFFFCDDRVGQPFAHKVRYVYVDTETGEATSEERTSWPTFNAQHFYPEAETYAASPDLVQKGDLPAFTARVARTGAAKALPGVTRAAGNPELFLLAFYAFRESVGSNLNTRGLTGKAGIPTSGQTQFLQPTENYRDTGTTFKNEVIKAARAVLDKAGTDDFALIDLNCHANMDANGQFFMFLPTYAPSGDPSGQQSNPDEMLRPEELGLDTVAACHMLIIAGMCFAGNWIIYAQQKLDKPGKEITLLCGSPADQFGYTYNRPEEGFGEAGAYFFRDEISKLSANAGQQGLLDAANIAVARSKTYFEEQVRKAYPDAETSNAVVWSRSPAEGEDCNLQIEPNELEVGVNQFVNFEVKVADRTESAPPLRIEVSTNLGDLSTASNGTGKRVTLTETTSIAFTSETAGDAVITAEAFESNVSVGKVTAKVTVKPVSVKIDPAKVSVMKSGTVTLTPSVENYEKVNPSHVIEYTWTVTGGRGTVASNTTTDATNGGAVVYRAGSSASDGIDTVTVTATLVINPSTRVTLGEAQAEVTVGERVGRVNGRPEFEWFPIMAPNGKWGIFDMRYVVVQKVPDARVYNLIVDGTPDRPTQETQFHNGLKASSILIGRDYITNLIPDNEYWLYDTGGQTNAYGSRERIDADIAKYRAAAAADIENYKKTVWVWEVKY